MPITITSAVIESMNVRFSQGVASQLEVSYIGTDSNGNAYPNVYRFTPNATQQTNIDNFVNGLIAQVQTATNVTITINPT